MAVNQEVMILLSLTRWIETVLYSQMFNTQVKFTTLDGNIAIVFIWLIHSGTKKVTLLISH